MSKLFFEIFNQARIEAKRRFGGAFSERLFLEQLVYFDDIADFQVVKNY